MKRVWWADSVRAVDSVTEAISKDGNQLRMIEQADGVNSKRFKQPQASAQQHTASIHEWQYWMETCIVDLRGAIATLQGDLGSSCKVTTDLSAVIQETRMELDMLKLLFVRQQTNPSTQTCPKSAEELQINDLFLKAQQQQEEKIQVVHNELEAVRLDVQAAKVHCKAMAETLQHHEDMVAKQFHDERSETISIFEAKQVDLVRSIGHIMQQTKDKITNWFQNECREALHALEAATLEFGTAKRMHEELCKCLVKEREMHFSLAATHHDINTTKKLLSRVVGTNHVRLDALEAVSPGPRNNHEGHNEAFKRSEGTVRDLLLSSENSNGAVQCIATQLHQIQLQGAKLSGLESSLQDLKLQVVQGFSSFRGDVGREIATIKSSLVKVTTDAEGRERAHVQLMKQVDAELEEGGKKFLDNLRQECTVIKHDLQDMVDKERISHERREELDQCIRGVAVTLAAKIESLQRVFNKELKRIHVQSEANGKAKNVRHSETSVLTPPTERTGLPECASFPQFVALTDPGAMMPFVDVLPKDVNNCLAFLATKVQTPIDPSVQQNKKDHEESIPQKVQDLTSLPKSSLVNSPELCVRSRSMLPRTNTCRSPNSGVNIVPFQRYIEVGVT